MSLVPYLSQVARGKGRGRPLDLTDARAAMDVILNGDVTPEALGAFLMVLRFRGETPEEIAGFTAALRARTALAQSDYDLDWPCYAAGRTRGAPLFLLSAKLVAQAGYRVVLHGWNSNQQGVACVRSAVQALEIPVMSKTAPLSYMPLEELSTKALELLQLRQKFGLRSCVNTLMRMWNPMDARASVQGVFHPVYRGLQAQAAELLGQQALSVIKGGGGEFERNPAKAIRVFGLREGNHIQSTCPAFVDETRRLHEDDAVVDPLALWTGQSSDPFATAVVTGTAALALWTLDTSLTLEAAQEQAEALWAERHDPERKSA